MVPIDRTPYQRMAYYQREKTLLRQLAAQPRPRPGAGLRAGWAKVNLTPAYATPTAGYGNRRGNFEGVHDSIFARAIVLDNGGLRVALVSVDLLIVPPTVTAQLKKKLPAIGFSLARTYLAATHSHNSLGAWGERFIGQVFAGQYDQRVVDHITNSIVKAVDAAQQQLAPTQVGYDRVAAPEFVYNRLLGEGGAEDPFVRLLKLRKTTGETALLCTYAAHATCLSAAQKQLSRDYPGQLVDALEKKGRASVDFAVFMAGAVGSQGPAEPNPDDFRQMRSLATGLDQKIEQQLEQIPLRADSTLRMLSLPLALREPHWKLAKNWRMRPWLYGWLYGYYPSEIKALRIGNTVLLGTPCDFSGELVRDFDAVCRQKGVDLMVTSFNGGYVGY
ncbi:MAG: neutral/alkaline non-lysosomal ceramidase N-terminal domain-containing protein, partial [Hymenobacter sp.]|nr:neutral/alkaline non-lysosomal ceramidase N-terminal domain-containing protein [Hymenobacter sp.]